MAVALTSAAPSIVKVLETKEGQNTLKGATEIAKEASHAYITTTQKVADSAVTTVFDSDERRQVGSDVKDAVLGIGSLIEGSISKISNAGIQLGENLNLYTSNETKFNDALLTARGKFNEAFSREMKNDRKIQAGENAYLNSISRSKLKLSSADMDKINANLEELKSRVGNSAELEKNGGCDECGGNSGIIKMGYLGGIMADSVVNGGGEGKIGITQIIILSLFLIALYHWSQKNDPMIYNPENPVAKKILLAAELLILIMVAWGVLSHVVKP